MVRQAHHERVFSISVRPEPVEGRSGFLKILSPHSLHSHCGMCADTFEILDVDSHPGPDGDGPGNDSRP